MGLLLLAKLSPKALRHFHLCSMYNSAQLVLLACPWDDHHVHQHEDRHEHCLFHVSQLSWKILMKRIFRGLKICPHVLDISYHVGPASSVWCGVFNVICCIPWLYVFGDKICDSWCHMTWHDIGEMLKMVNRCCLQCLSACSLLESEVVGSPGLLLSAPAATSQLRLCHELKAPARAKAAPPPNLLSQPSLPPHTHWQSYFSPVN